MEYDFQIIANLMAGKGEAKDKLESLKKFLDDNGQIYRVLAIDTPTPISQLPSDGRMHIKKGVICLGGDGTVSETVGYVLNNKISAPIALIPTGTANIIASTLNLNTNRQDFEFLLKDSVINVDVGLVEYSNEKDYLLLGLGLGFEEKFLKLTKEKLKGKFGVFSYVLAAMAELLSLKSIPLKIIADGKEIKVKVCLLTVFNLQPKIFNFFPLFKNGEISGSDGVLDLFYVEYKNYFQALAGTLLFHIFGKRNLGLVKKITAKGIVLEPESIVPTQIDGELRGNLPVRVSLLPKKCTFLVP